MVALKYVVVVIQIILSLILIGIVLFQHGSQRGLSGSIAGGAETFFGKNKGRTIDAKLKKWTAVVAVLFLISSIALNIVITSEEKANEAAALKAAQEAQQQQVEANTEGENKEAEVQPEGEAETEADDETQSEAE